MNEQKQVAIILAKCNTNGKTFGMRTEKRGSAWAVTWAFPINEGQAKREGYDKTTISGDIDFADEYPGCPYCKGNAIALCVCGRVNCVDPGHETFTCNWCRAKGGLGRYNGEAITAGTDV